MPNGSGSPYTSRKSDLERFLDVLYVLTKESEPICQGNLCDKKKAGIQYTIVSKILKKCEEKGFVKHYKVGTRKKYELLERGKELIHTWLDYVHTFNLKKLLKSKYVEPLPEMESYSRLKKIIRRPLDLEAKYVKSSRLKPRSTIMLYRDFLAYLKSYYPEYTYQEKIRPGININGTKFKVFKNFAIKRKKKHIEIEITGVSKWKPFVIKRGEFEISPTMHIEILNNKTKSRKLAERREPNELIRITKDGIRCLKTFDKIMMEFELTDLVHTYLKPYQKW